MEVVIIIIVFDNIVIVIFYNKVVIDNIFFLGINFLVNNIENVIWLGY